MNIFGNNNFNIITESGGNMVDNGSTVSNITSTAVQSTVNGDSFTESLKQQLINTIVMAGADYGANKIGEQYHSNNLNFGVDGTTGTVLNKLTQLGLHAGLGAITNELTGNDALSGALSGVSAEVFTDIIGNALYGTTSGNELTKDQKDTLKNIGGLTGGLTSIIVSKSQGNDIREITNNAYSGQRIGQNAVENNLLYTESVRNNKYKTVYDNFGPRYKDPKTGKYSSVYKEGYVKRDVDHLGTDIASPAQEEIYSVADGKVILNSNIRGYGNTIIVETEKNNGSKVWALYGHMYELSNLQVGSKVQEGQPIGKVGNTGVGEGNHLHLGISFGDKNGKYSNREGWVNPKYNNIGNYEYRKDTPYYKQHYGK